MRRKQIWAKNVLLSKTSQSEKDRILKCEEILWKCTSNTPK